MDFTQFLYPTGRLIRTICVICFPPLEKIIVLEFFVHFLQKQKRAGLFQFFYPRFYDPLRTPSSLDEHEKYQTFFCC
jgi:hypothetical protein